MSVQNTIETLMTTYTQPLRRINCSIPGGSMIVATVLKKNNSWHNHIVFNGNSTVSKKNNSRRNRVVFLEGNRSMRTSSSTPLNIKSKKGKVKKNCINVSVKQERGMLKVKGPETGRDELVVLTDFEKSLFAETEPSNKRPRISVFERLGNKANNYPTRISVFERLGGVDTSQKLQKNDNPTENEEHEIRTPDNEPVEFIDNVQPAPSQIEDGGQATVDELQEINLGTDEEPRPIFVSALLTPNELENYKCLLQEYRDVFAWGYQDMPGLDPNVAVHRLAVSSQCRCVKQAPRRF
ncbi:hypothetical protein L3X38_015271 [Prunus dulcis]|uniref:Uncharacterized protein n=1 Tax=Prunus dulcis TaxID=3755 RepID=A0AAD4ZHV7_PRUDU|nr:hypothetical protein L3X38_015271 [Prunus dulcis]